MATKSPDDMLLQTVPGDPINVMQYTLANGMRLFLSVNTNEPRIHTNIVVRAGSKQDPSDATGMAHYMEHMLFKGTSRIGALNWEREEQYLKEIAALYEEHRRADNEAERAAIYQKIDRLSSEAARLAAPNEYDKLASAIGAKDTNAYTWVEQTVYVNDIPSNELERWMQLEAERFRMMALRLFHTELETVYEEFNISQDQDYRKANQAIREALFPQHPYGTQPTIGHAHHLKNPSHLKIQEYFRSYYVPNNMALVLAGEFDPEQAIELAERYFGAYQPRELPPLQLVEQPPLESPVRRDVYGQQSPFVDIAWRLNGARTDDPLMATILQQLLYNQQAGLLDIHVNQQQRALYSNAWYWVYEDYSVLGLLGKPREGQSLEEVKELLLEELEKLKQGQFEGWLLEAVIRNMRLHEVKSNESNHSRADTMSQAFILGIPWERMSQRFQWWGKLTVDDVMAFARRHLDDNYVEVYKHQGKDEKVVKVQKPPITAVELRRDALSEFGKAFLSRPASRLQPVFADFEGSIHSRQLQPGLIFDYVHNPDNEFFRLDYIFERSKLTDPRLPLALLYLPYLGTNRYSPEGLQREFFRLGLSMDVNFTDERSYLTASGLDESLEEGLQLMEHLLESLQESQAALDNLVSDILVKRSNAKKNRNNILRNAMANYARYGPGSAFTLRLSEKQLRQLQPEELAGRIRELPSFEHTLHYYGPRRADGVAALLKQHHRVPGQLKPVGEKRLFAQLATEANEVFFLDFPIVQADVMMISRGTPTFNIEEHFMREWYNEYFGYGLSSIVFQEIRESKALAYSTYAYYTSPNRKGRAHYLQAYLGTQPDKLEEALDALSTIIEEMPLVPGQAHHARQSILLRLESERIPPSKIYWEYRAARQLGFSHDLRRELYEHLKGMDSRRLADFHRQYVKGRAFKYLVLGSRKEVSRQLLEKLGPVRELSLEDVFGY